MGWARQSVVASLIVLAGCGRSCRRPTPTPPPVDAAPPVATASVAAPASVEIDTGPPPMPDVEELATIECPARIATVKLDGGSVEAIACPEGEGYEKHVKGRSRLVLLDASGKQLDEVTLNEDPYAMVKVAVEDLYGDQRPVFMVTVTVPTMGSWGGPTTTPYQIERGHLRPILVNGNGKALELTSAIKITWWTKPARSGRGKDIYKIVTTVQGTDEGTRYAFEDGKWVAHKGALKNWTGEHLSDTEDEFP